MRMFTKLRNSIRLSRKRIVLMSAIPVLAVAPSRIAVKQVLIQRLAGEPNPPPVLVVSASTERVGVMVSNEISGRTIYVGPNSSVNPDNGFQIIQGVSNVRLDTSSEIWAYPAIPLSGGTVRLYVIEFFYQGNN